MFMYVDGCHKHFRIPSDWDRNTIPIFVSDFVLALIGAALYALQRGSHAALSGCLAALQHHVQSRVPL
jgi:hypothetical protein